MILHHFGALAKMAIFISYSHEDSDFVDTLAANLVRAKHHIWMDRWELNVGDSLTSKIESTLTESSAILVILSKNSVESDWCKRELTAGLVRELEEKKTLVLPVVIDDCSIPLFLRDKLNANFKKNPDKAFDQLDRALAKISNSTSTRFETPDFHTDFSIDWKRSDDPETEETWIIRLTFVDHSEKFPFVVVSECKVYEVDGKGKFNNALKDGSVMKFAKELMAEVVKGLEEKPLSGVISDNLMQYVAWQISPPKMGKYVLAYTYRRLGEDTGLDTVVYLDNNLKLAYKYFQSTVRDTLQEL